jgi:hypothetical protein
MGKSEVEYIMASYKLRAADLDAVRKQASMYAELKPGYRSWFPIETIPRAVTSKWYQLTRTVAPLASMDGSSYVGVRTARTEDSAPIFWLRYKFHWDITEVESATRAGVPLRADDAMVALQQMDNKLSQYIINGMDYPDVINGLTEDGTSNATAAVVGTADNFITHALAGGNHLLTHGFRGPYHWIVSDTVAQYLGLPLGAGGGLSQGSYIDQILTNLGGAQARTFIERADVNTDFDLHISEDTEEIIFPMVYNTNDGIWVMIAANPENMALQQVAPPQVIVNPELNRDTNKYEGYVEWQGTIRITHPTAAIYHETVNIA